MSKEIPTPTEGAIEHASRTERNISDAEQEAFSLLMPKHRELSIKLDDFEDVYGPEEIDRDRNSIERKKSKMEGLDSAIYKRAQLLEAILAEQIELSDWFGENVMTIIPNEFDDLFNGIDLTTEFEKEGSYQYMAMGIDVTSSRHPVKKKLETIKRHIKDGTLTQMKYFKSERNDIQGRMGKIPQLLIGADARTINELAALWLDTQRSRNPDNNLNQNELAELRQKAKEAQAKLAKHRAGILILKELSAQLEVYSEYASKIGSSETEAKYKNLLKIINEILSKRHISPSEEKENESDDVYTSIRNGLKTFSGL